jgi:chemotaxis protein histidine kinase CheA
MGIGAFQIRETLRAAGGKVEVESEPGEGTVVRMRLPLTVNAERTSREPAA